MLPSYSRRKEPWWKNGSAFSRKFLSSIQTRPYVDSIWLVPPSHRELKSLHSIFFQKRPNSIRAIILLRRHGASRDFKEPASRSLRFFQNLFKRLFSLRALLFQSWDEESRNGKKTLQHTAMTTKYICRTKCKIFSNNKIWKHHSFSLPHEWNSLSTNWLQRKWASCWLVQSSLVKQYQLNTVLHLPDRKRSLENSPYISPGNIYP